LVKLDEWAPDDEWQWCLRLWEHILRMYIVTGLEGLGVVNYGMGKTSRMGVNMTYLVDEGIDLVSQQTTE
jgi:hypothetical protein